MQLAEQNNPFNYLLTQQTKSEFDKQFKLRICSLADFFSGLDSKKMTEYG